MAETLVERTLGRDAAERRHGGVTLNGRSGLNDIVNDEGGVKEA
ncbi:MAG: hypothetical protein JWN27_2413 [Candidatus Eremiobacteraeota bacterium]|nr:hypothetical protein [Candidatus Eremiobacteraeota bacterium]